MKLQGFGLIEIVVGVGIVSSVVFGIMTAGNILARASKENVRFVQAGFLLEEGMELVRAARDDGWDANIAAQPLGTPRYLAVAGGTVTLGATPETVLGNGERSVTFSSVYRDGNDSIAETGTLDSQVRRVTITVGWQAGQTSLSRSAVGYISNLFVTP
ncbi:MAG: hypothetical protein HYS59_00850 [Candidatus Vogelbacteria bacterium]|nr:hypothetical protein [Candidatus Vogelbacteria bacterium]